MSEAPSLTDSLYEALGPLTTGDEQTGYQLRALCEALCEGSGMQTLYDYVRDRDDMPGWGILFDPEQCPPEALGWLAQFAGVTLNPELTEDEQREAIIEHSGWGRGRPAAMIRAIKRDLSDSKLVALEERLGGDAYLVGLRVDESELPDGLDVADYCERVTRNGDRYSKPIGLVLVPVDLGVWDWAAYADAHTDWDEASDSWTDWAAVPTHPE